VPLSHPNASLSNNEIDRYDIERIERQQRQIRGCGMTRIPIDRAAVIMRRFGPSGEQFLHELPDRLAQRAERWQLVLGSPYPVGIGGYLVQAERPDGSAAVLKLSPTGAGQARANKLEILMLRRYAGQGTVLLLDDDLGAGALLMERCIPGTTLDTLPDEEMVRRGCRLAHMLHTEPTSEDLELIPVALDSVTEGTRPFSVVMAELGESLSPNARRAVKDSHEELVADRSQLVVCHGDLNPGNVLAAQRLPWLAIDPLPRVADPAYDAASLVWARRPWLLAQPDARAVLAHRIHVAAGELLVDPERIRAWTLVRLVGVLAERHTWGGFDESLLIRMAELLTSL